jgi:hypothetical protein
LALYEDGKVYNTKTKRYIGAVGSGRYKKISCKDLSTGKIRHIQVHRLMWLHFKGPIPDEYEVDHKDGNSLHCALANFQLLTPSANVKKDMPRQDGIHNGYYKYWLKLQARVV